MRNFQDTFETRKRSFISVFSICMALPLRWTKTAIVKVLPTDEFYSTYEAHL